MYRNTQFGTVTVIGFMAAMVLCLWLDKVLPDPPVAKVLAGVLVIVSLLFYKLTVEVTPERIRCWFGVGLIRKSIPMRDVARVMKVRNRWIYGWGIRRVPGAWMFNVSGLDAVELTLESGKRFRIGTDDSEGLVTAINRARIGSP